MSDATPPVGEDDLHAYLDRQLPVGRRLIVERHLEKIPNPHGKWPMIGRNQRERSARWRFVDAIDVRHPVELPGTEAPHLQQWLFNRLDRTIVAPDLSVLGYHLIGGRLLATERGGDADLLMYDDASHQRISVRLRPMTRTLTAPKNMLQQDGVNGCAWIVNGLGVAVVAALPKGDIKRLVKQIGTDLGTSG
jgi:anti-sigma factor RsiW